MPSGPSNQESSPLLPLHSNLLTSSGSSSTPTRSRLSARRYIPSSSVTGKGKGKAKIDDLEEGLSLLNSDNEDDDISKKSKIKGKGKAKEEGKGRNITIIFSNESDLTGNGNLECWIEDGENVGSLKEQIKTLRPTLQSHNIRLIHSGRLLTDGILLIPWLRSLEERVKRQAAGVGGDVENVLKEVGLTEDLSSTSSDDDEDEDENNEDNEDKKRIRQLKKRESKDDNNPNERVWLHCIVGGKEEKTRTEEEDEPSAPRRRGFDVLLDAGLSADDVAAMRRQFYESRGEEVPEGMEGGDVNDEHARALEEQWIEGDLTAETAATTSEGMYSSILHGLLTGFLFPITPWFFFREPPLPNFFDSDFEAITISQSTTNQDNLGSSSRLNSTNDNIQNIERPLSPNPATTTTTTTVENTSAQDRFIRAGGIGIGLGEIVASQVFGKRMQMGILLGTILNLSFGALRFLN